MRIAILAVLVSILPLSAFAGPAVSTGTGERASLRYDDYFTAEYKEPLEASRKEDAVARPVQYQPQVQDTNTADVQPAQPLDEATP